MSNEMLAIVSSGAVLLFSVLLLFIVTRVMGKVDGATFVAILVVPVLIYALLSGRLQEFSGPGGWGAKFRTAVADAISITPILEDAQQLSVVEKGGLEQLRSFADTLDPKLPNAVSLRVGAPSYVADVIATYIRTLQGIGSATYVVFVNDATGAFIGSANGAQILALLENPATTGEFMNELQSPGAEPFSRYEFLTRVSLQTSDTNKTALEKFLDSGASALVVVEDGSKPLGIVDRNRLITKLMINLAADEA
jgi:hypothetical protein